MTRSGWPSLALFVPLIAISPPCLAQDMTAASETKEIEPSTFLNAFFAEFRPNSALDMINRLPGFTYSRGNGGVRGLAGSSGNVMIDGQRPVTKSLSLDDVIRQIPVDVVVRIDLIRSGAAGFDLQGHAMVANIIRNPNGFATFTGEIATKLYDDHHLPARIARLETAFSAGSWNAAGAISWRQEREQGNSGTGNVVRRDFANGRETAGHFEAAWQRRLFQANGNVEYRTARDMIRLSLSGESALEHKNDLIALSDFGSTRDEKVLSRVTSDEAELSLDYEHTLSQALAARVMALQKIERDIRRSSSTGRGLPQESSDLALEGESILRLAATYSPFPLLTIEASAEGSFNFLDARSRFTRGGSPVLVPSANIRIEERRGNLAGSVRWQTASWLTLETGLGYERSTLTQTGDAARSKILQYWKPSATAAIDPAAGWQVRLRAERVIGQLNFGDFAASVSLEPGNVSAGNPDLVPERSWLLEGAIERRFWNNGAITLAASHAEISDVIDFIPIENRFDAPGNAGDGWRREMRLGLTLPLERLSLTGLQVRASATLRDSRITDPVLGIARRISRERPLSGEVLVTKDLPTLNSIIGTEVYFGFEETFYRLSEVRIERSSADPLARLYWEWNPNARTAIRFQVENFTFRRRSQTRSFFDGSRLSGVIVGSENREVTMNPFLLVRMRRRL